ncbi:MAG: hypothetical protein IT384_33995 [Deltaproteobacteria bacterium]|nr:hypothetical protein [Deltaproteobacteria bacterium]
MTRTRHGHRSQQPRSDTPVTPEDLAAAPELAVVILLEHAIAVTADALLAAHPALIGEPPAWRVTKDLIAARHLLRAASRLARTIVLYRDCVLPLVRDRPSNAPATDF